MKDINLNDLDLTKIGIWPWPVKAGVVVVLCALVLALAWFLDTRHQLDTLDSVQHKEGELKRTFEQKQAKAANLDAYRQQMAEMKQSFGAMLRQLPSKTEVDSLLVDISQTGLASGVEFRLFKPTAERQLEFYAEQPIDVEVTGTYHEFGEFVSGVAALPRIVTLHNLTVSGGGKGSGKLTMKLQAKTYRYLDDEELAQRKRAQKKNKKRR